MPNNYFKFKQFTICQDKCAMKVGTDGVLLGAWTNCDNSLKILDVGTGTGLIALMLAQRSKAIIYALEIDKNASVQAKENIQKSSWSERVNVFNQSFQEFVNESDTTYDLIVSNPPYFQNSLLAPDAKRTMARHDASLNYDEIIEGTIKLLSENGKLSIILPYLEGTLFIVKASEKGLYCNRQTKVIPRPNQKPKRLLLEFMKIKMPLVEQEIIIELNKRHQYSDAYKNLTRNFYLAF